MMWKKAAIAILLAGGAALYAGDYQFELQAPAKVGADQLKAGEYKVAVKGAVAIITDLKTEKSYTTMVKTETGDKKYPATLVETTNRNGQIMLQSISVGGSTTRLTFNN